MSDITFTPQPANIHLNISNKTVLKLTADGRIELGEGASADEATRVLFEDLAMRFDGRVSQQAAEIERLRAELAQAREALRFYACACQSGACEVDNPKSVSCGGTARAALEDK